MAKLTLEAIQAEESTPDVYREEKAYNIAKNVARINFSG